MAPWNARNGDALSRVGRYAPTAPWRSTPAADGTIVIPTAGLASGSWRLRVQWSADGRDYYVERDLRLP